MEAEVRVAVALVGAPGVDVGITVPGVLASQPDRFAKGFATQHVAVEGGGETLASLVVYRPARSNHRADTHANELFAKVGGESESVKLASTIDAAKVAAIDENQFRHETHLFNVTGRQEGVVTNHHAGNWLIKPMRGWSGKFVHAVSGEVENAPAVLV